MGAMGNRIGGLFGLAAAAVIIPAYVVGSPETPRTGTGAQNYFDDASTFLTANGTLPLLHLLFGVVFIGVLVALLRNAGGPSGAVYIALIGSVMYLTLTAAGVAAEVAVPAATAQFNDLTVVAYSQPFLALSVWLYHFSQIGSAALIFASAFIVWRTAVLPRWTALLAVLGILPLIHTWMGLYAAYSTIAWIALMGLLLLALPAYRPPMPPAAETPPTEPEKSQPKHQSLGA
jgi:hypothetical protein